MAKWSEAIEDYLKHIYLLSPENKQVGGQALAARMNISQASVTAMLKRLSAAGLVDYEPYRGVRLLPAGEKIALEIVRHHRLIESYLSEVLGMGWDEVHAEAEILEHHLSDRLEALMAEKLGHPDFDPHGHPIPRSNGDLPQHEGICVLAEVGEGDTCTVRAVRNDDDEVLRYLQKIGIVPNRTITVREQAPLGGPLTVVNDAGTHHAIHRPLAELIDVARS